MKRRNGHSPPARATQAVSVDAQFHKAAALHQAGNLGEAGKLYEQVLLEAPDHFNALQLSGLLAFQTSRFEAAEAFFKKAISIRSDVAGVYANYGLMLKQLRRFDEALATYDKAVAIMPASAQTCFVRGSILQELKRFDEAVVSYGAAIAIQPDFVEAYASRGHVFYELGLFDQSVNDYDRAIRIKPDFAEAYSNRGNALIKLRTFEPARASFERAIALRPDLAEAYSNLGNVLNELGRFEEGLAACRKAITLKPDYADASCNLGRSLNKLGRHEEAVANFARAIDLAPNFSEAYSNLGAALQELKRFDEAIAAWYKAASLRPADPKPYYNMSHVLLLNGNFQDGLEFYEWRKKLEEPLGALSFHQPLWLGKENLENKKILIHEEQGIGDVIQFCRYVPLLKARGASVVLAVRSPLIALLQTLPANVEICSMDHLPESFDFHCPLMSLPLAFGTWVASIPACEHYLKADAFRIEEWKARIGGEGFRIGVCWQGSTGNADAGRSFPLRQFQTLSQIPGVRLISLHKGEGEAQLRDLPVGMTVETLGEGFDGGPDAFLDTAAVMTCCDLVITSDTSVAHLAGALGVRTWVALKYAPDWRWLLDRDDSPWYPSMRLFRQQSPGDWDGVFAAIGAALSEELLSR